MPPRSVVHCRYGHLASGGVVVRYAFPKQTQGDRSGHLLLHRILLPRNESINRWIDQVPRLVLLSFGTALYVSRGQAMLADNAGGTDSLFPFIVKTETVSSGVSKSHPHWTEFK